MGRKNGNRNSRQSASTIGENDHHIGTPSLCSFRRKVLFTRNHDLLDDAVTQLCPVVMKQLYCVRPVQGPENGVKASVVAGVLDLVMVVDSWRRRMLRNLLAPCISFLFSLFLSSALPNPNTKVTTPSEGCTKLMTNPPHHIDELDILIA